MQQDCLLRLSILLLTAVALNGCPPPVPPIAAFTYAPLSGEAPLEVSFQDASDAGSSAITTWHWDFGDLAGSTSDAAAPSFTYTEAGTYTVTLTVTTSVGSDTTTASIVVSPAPEPPLANFTYTPASGTAPLEVSFEDISEPGTASIATWLWEFGDPAGSTSDEQNPTFTFTEPGTYTVTLTVTTSVGSDTVTTDVVVEPVVGEACEEGALFGQAPPFAGEAAFIVWADESVNNVMYDNFSGIGAPVGAVEWWGFNATGDSECTREPNTYSIRFFSGDAEPDELVAKYTVVPTLDNTELEFQGLTLVRFGATLDPVISIASGWISITGIGGSECKARMLSSADGDQQCIAENLETSEFFIVGHDLAFCLAGEAEGR